MLKAVVFDDEYIVLQGFRNMIDWSQYGIELVGAAQDGNSALSIFRTYRPDILFTDIRMPGMDGLQLIKTVLEEAPETLCIVFSGFNEFEYVKQALKLGVVDYLDKPITISKINDALQRVIDRISQQKEVSQLREETRRERLEKATLDLLLHGSEAEVQRNWKESFGDSADQITGVTVVACSAAVPPLDEHLSYRSVLVRNGSHRLHVVFHLSDQTDYFWEQLFTWSNRTAVTVGAGQTYPHIQDAQTSYKEALRALRYGRFLKEEGLVRFEEVGGDFDLSYNSEREEAIIFYMRKGDKAGLQQQLDHFIRSFESRKLDPDLLDREILKLVYLGMEVVKEVGGDALYSWQVGYMPHLEIHAIETKRDKLLWLCNQMQKMIEMTAQVRQTTKHSAIEQARQYIEDHFNKDLTLQEIATQVGLNPTYFSLLFKEEMGQSYIKYLTQLRMERAKAMLREGQKVVEVSEKVGYHNYRHFSELFKKYYGTSPGKYKEYS